MTDTCKIYIVRHGESVANRDDICGGDYPLTDKGRAQAAETRELLKSVRFDAAYSSDFVRAADTAAIIAGHEIAAEHRLTAFREREFGSLDGQPNSVWMAIKDIHDAKYSHLPFESYWQVEYAADVESDKVLGERFMDGLKAVGDSNPGKSVLVVSSAGPIRVLLMKLGFAKFLMVGSFKNAGYVELDYDGQDFTVGEVVGIQDPPKAAG